MTVTATATSFPYDKVICALDAQFQRLIEDEEDCSGTEALVELTKKLGTRAKDVLTPQILTLLNREYERYGPNEIVDHEDTEHRRWCYSQRYPLIDALLAMHSSHSECIQFLRYELSGRYNYGRFSAASICLEYQIDSLKEEAIAVIRHSANASNKEPSYECAVAAALKFDIEYEVPEDAEPLSIKLIVAKIEKSGIDSVSFDEFERLLFSWKYDIAALISSRKFKDFDQKMKLILKVIGSEFFGWKYHESLSHVVREMGKECIPTLIKHLHTRSPNSEFAATCLSLFPAEDLQKHFATMVSLFFDSGDGYRVTTGSKVSSLLSKLGPIATPEVLEYLRSGKKDGKICSLKALSGMLDEDGTVIYNF